MTRRLALAAATFLLGAAAATPAAAASRYSGECTFVPLDVSPPAVLVAVNVALYSTDPKDLPVAAGVHCLLYDSDGRLAVAETFSGSTHVSGARVVQYWPPAFPRACTVVDYTSDASPTESSCAPYADVLLCPFLRALVPGVGPVSIVREGDVYVAGTLVWDCPPYV